MTSTIEEYVQETGRAERDGECVEAVIYEGKVGKNCTKKMKNYANTETCRRKFLFSDFLRHFEKDICEWLQVL